MLIDTHCHINMMVKKSLDTYLSQKDYQSAQDIINQAHQEKILALLNVGTSLIESVNCIELARVFKPIYASVGIHPNDLTDQWRKDIEKLTVYTSNAREHKIVAIGECGIDLHYPDYNLTRQQDAFKQQIELALERNLALIVHSRDGAQETLQCLEEFKDPYLRGTFHCFSYDIDVAYEAIKLGFVLGIGGTITYPKNKSLRDTVRAVGLEHLVLETDAPFLPPQHIRGKQNNPAQIKAIAQYIAELLEQPFDTIAAKTTQNAQHIFTFV
jgi:TatD DNase family protein